MNAYQKFPLAYPKIHKGLKCLIIGGNEMVKENVLGLRDMSKEEILEILQISVKVNPIDGVVVTREVGE